MTAAQAGDPATPPAAQPVPPRTVAAIALGTLLNPLNSSMIAVALVALQRAFGVGVAASSWLVSGFYLAACVGQPLMGRVADRFGPRRVFCTGLVLVCLAGIVAVLAPGFGTVLACRVVQAMGTSAAFPAGLAILRRTAGTPRPPAAALAGITVTNSGSAAFGPVLGGFLLAVAGWRGIFAVNIPVTAVGLVLALRWLPPDGGHPARAPAGTRAVRLRRVLGELDLPGVLLFALTMAGLLAFLLSLGTRPNWPILAVFLVAAGALVWRERRAAVPFLDVASLAGNRALVGVLAQQVGVQLVFYALFFGLPMWMERVRGLPGSAVGLLILPVAALGVALTPVAAWLVRRRGPGTPMVAGSAALVLGAAAVLALREGTPLFGIVAVTAALGLPNAFNNLGLQAALYSSAPPGQTGLAAGLFQTARYVGAILSTALLGVVLEHDLSDAGLHRVGYVTTFVAVLLFAGTLVGRRRDIGRHRCAHRQLPSVVGSKRRS